ncbi:hypothetical protein Tco_0418063 [Tanacetum coccineum]
MVPRAVLMKSGLVSINTARQNFSKIAVLVNAARQVNDAHTKSTVNGARSMSNLCKTTHSTVKRPIQRKTSFKNSNINQRVNTVKGKKINTALAVNTARPKATVNTARPKAVVNVVKGNCFNDVKASTCWVWKPKTNVLDHVSKHNSALGNPQMDLQDQGVIDSGCSRHMIGNMSYLTDYEEIDEGYVAFGGNPKGGKIIRKGSGPDWLFDIDALIRTMNYKPIVAGTRSNGFVGTKASGNAGQARKETEPVKYYILLPLWTADPPFSQDLKSSHDARSKPSSDDGKKDVEDPRKESDDKDQENDVNVNRCDNVNAASKVNTASNVNIAGLTVNDASTNEDDEFPFDPNMPDLEDVGTF